METFSYYSTAMKVTNNTISLIKSRLRDPKKPKINQSQIAESMGLGKAWVSKLMNRKLQTLSDEQVERLEEVLGIPLQAFVEKTNKIDPLALEISRKMQENASLAKAVQSLLELDCSCKCGPKWIETQDMTKIGQEIIRICFANDDKPGKVARMVLEILR
jgi:transcriptional regulator with XRE-family HTH domain